MAVVGETADEESISDLIWSLAKFLRMLFEGGNIDGNRFGSYQDELCQGGSVSSGLVLIAGLGFTLIEGPKLLVDQVLGNFTFEDLRWAALTIEGAFYKGGAQDEGPSQDEQSRQEGPPGVFAAGPSRDSVVIFILF